MSEFSQERYLRPDQLAELDTLTERVGDLARFVTADPAQAPTDEQTRNVLQQVGFAWRTQSGLEGHFNLWSFGQDIRHFLNNGQFQEAHERPILVAAGIYEGGLRVVAEHGLADHPNVDSEAVATIVGAMFERDLYDSEFVWSEPAPFYVGRLADLLPEREVREQFIVDCLQKAFTAFEQQPTEEHLLLRGQQTIDCILRATELPSAEVIQTTVEYAMKYGSPKFLSGLRNIRHQRPEVWESQVIPFEDLLVIEEALESYKTSSYLRQNDRLNDRVVEALRQLPEAYRRQRLTLLLPQMRDVVLQGFEKALDQESASSSLGVARKVVALNDPQFLPLVSELECVLGKGEVGPVLREFGLTSATPEAVSEFLQRIEEIAAEIAKGFFDAPSLLEGTPDPLVEAIFRRHCKMTGPLGLLVEKYRKEFFF